MTSGPTFIEFASPSAQIIALGLPAATSFTAEAYADTAFDHGATTPGIAENVAREMDTVRLPVDSEDIERSPFQTLLPVCMHDHQYT
jgi:hypothetical protein